MIAKKPKVVAYIVIIVALITAVTTGCNSTGERNGGESSTDENSVLYDCAGLTTAIPNEYLNLLIIETFAYYLNPLPMVTDSG